MKPYLHGKISAKKWGGTPEDYQEIHDFMDSPKAAHPDMRHKAILHNAFGCFIVFGNNKLYVGYHTSSFEVVPDDDV